MPKSELLTYEEICVIAERFIGHGIRKIRLTGGEPLVRRDMEQVIARLGEHVASGALDELTLTTNGSLLHKFADHLVRSNVRRINVSLDTLDEALFSKITRRASLTKVLTGIEAAKKAGLQIKINMVALRNQNETSLLPMAEWCAENGYDLSLIETMPLGEIDGERQDDYISLQEFTQPLHEKYDVAAINYNSAGPARYSVVEPLGLRLGMITPLSQNFCDACNRIRLTTDGKIYMCLGHDSHVDLRQSMRNNDWNSLDEQLRKALHLKPLRHDFEEQLFNGSQKVERHMSVTGG